MTTWERKSKAVISLTITHLSRDIERGNIDEHDLRRILSKKYPFGERVQPYKIWLRCVNDAIFDVFGGIV